MANEAELVTEEDVKAQTSPSQILEEQTARDLAIIRKVVEATEGPKKYHDNLQGMLSRITQKLVQGRLNQHKLETEQPDA